MNLFQTVKQIGIFIICAQVIMHFKPSAKYEKYLKLLISVMVLVQVIMPLVNIISGKEDTYFWAKVEEIQRDIDKSMERLEIENAINEENIINQTLEEIKTRINNNIKNNGMQVVSVEYAEDDNKNKLVFNMTEKVQYPAVNIKVDIINVAEQEVMGKAVSGETVNNSQERMEKSQVLYNIICDELGMNEEQIEVVWNG